MPTNCARVKHEHLSPTIRYRWNLADEAWAPVSTHARSAQANAALELGTTGEGVSLRMPADALDVVLER